MYRQFELLRAHRPTKPLWQVSLLVIGISVLAVTSQAYINRFLPNPYFFFFFPAAILTARFAGFRAALVTIALCVLAADFFYYEPYMAFGFNTLGENTTLSFVAAASAYTALAISRLESKERTSTLAMHELETTLHSIGDAVLVVDRNKSVAFLNPVAEQMTGWKLAEARGRSMEEVFKIVNEETRKPTENPVERVFREGRVVGLANHTVLIARDGKESMIEDSAAPIVMAGENNPTGVVLVFRDVTSKYQAEAKIKESEERLQLALSSAKMGTFHVNLKTNKVTTSPELAKILGLDEYTDNVFDSIDKMIHPEDREKTNRLFKEAVEKQIPYENEYRIIQKSGLVKWIMSRATVVLDENGKPVAFSGVTVDIDDLKKTEEELRKAKEEAERANELKSAFLANMSHEIRTPLGAMIGFADLLRDPGLSSGDRENYTEILARNGESLSIIINDILDLSKVEAGQLSLELTHFNPRHIAEDVVSLLRVKAREKDLSFDFVCEESAPQDLVSDPLRIRQILLNIVGNAIKFTQYGTVRIKCFGCKTDDGRSAVCYEVEDTGIGIPEAQKEKVFETFVQADGSMTRRFGGTGLGLALSKRLAVALGGDITITASHPNKGSTFLITIEDQPSKVNTASGPERVKRQDREIAPNALAGLRILVVDDSPDNRQLIWRYLTKQGASVDTAENGLLGYRQAVSGNYDIVLMDIQMPEMDGYTATHKLRQAGYRKPIIALTAHAMSDVRQRCLNVGCNTHLPKPINPNELIGTIIEFAGKAI